MSNKTHDMEHSADFYHGLLVQAEAEIEPLRTELADAAGFTKELGNKLTALRMAAECLVEEIEHVVGTAVVADIILAIEASR